MNFRRIIGPQILLVAFSLYACQNSGNRALFDGALKVAQTGNPEAQYYVGMMLNNGIGVAKDPGKAFEWFLKASTAGDPLASYKVGCYLGGQFEGVVPVDHDRSLHYKLIAAKAGYSLAQTDVGNAYAQQEKLEEAVRWWTLAAKQGHPRALYNLSVSFKEGKGAPKDTALAYAYFKLAKLASEGRVNENAQAQLDELKGIMSPDNIQKAESFVNSWKAQPTPLTVKASAGLDEARKLLN